ncbi:MAG: hypothetical protein KIT23_08500 [Sphingopyxis sp.]|nr:hypothetical protein [Sphingopyxis sp.]
MSAMSDAFAALKNVMLMEERIDGLRSDMFRSADDLRSLTEKVHSLDKRVLRIETMIEMSGRGGNQPRIEG